jgi:hypothetical protein
VIQYLNDDSVYDPLRDVPEPPSQQQDTTSQQTRLLSDLLQSRLFPRLQALLQDAEPMPLYALKLLSAVVEKNPPLFARQLRRAELLPLVAEHYQVGHPRLNRHTINIVKAVVQSKELTLTEV